MSFDATTLMSYDRTISFLFMFRKTIFIFGTTEITIGATTLIAILSGVIANTSQKPLNVLIFVIISSIISASLGAGLLLRWHYARKLLIFFAGWVILSKILIFAKIIFLCCDLETTLAPDLKNIVSILYHSILIFCLHQPCVKKEFGL